MINNKNTKNAKNIKTTEKKRHLMYINVGDGIVTLSPDSKFYK